MNQQQQILMNQPQIMNPHHPPHPQQQMMQQPMMNRSYGMWAPQQQQQGPPSMAPNLNVGPMNAQGFGAGGGGMQSKALGPRNNWKGKKANKNDKRMGDGRRRKEKGVMGSGAMIGGGGGVANSGVGGSVGGFGGGGYKPPTLNELQYQNRVKARRFFPKKKFHNNYNNNGNMKAPFAPRNTTSFIIRAKKSGGIASLVSPYPVTPAVLPTPMFSPSREVLVDLAKEEWGVDGYGSMSGLIRLRSPGQEGEVHEDEEDEDGGSSESDVEEHVEVERRLDHDLSRFEMIYPNSSGVDGNNVLENRVDDQDNHIAQLEEENLILKERLFLMENELGDLRMRLQSLERQSQGFTEEVVDNDSEDSESRGEADFVDNDNAELVEENMKGGYGDVKGKEEEANHGAVDFAQNEMEEKNDCTLLNETVNEEENIGINVSDRESNKDSDARDENKVEVTQINDNKTNIESSNNAAVGDETMEEAPQLDTKEVSHANSED